MSHLDVGAPWEYDEIKFHGLSLSGVRTSIAMPDLQIAFDVAQGYPFLFPAKKFFISHGHLDHSAGIPYIISQKNLYQMEPSQFFMPPSLCGPLTEIIRLWEKIEDHQYRFEFLPVSTAEITLNAHHFVKAFPTYHRVESFGYTLFKRTKKLAARFHGADRKTLLEAKSRGELIEDTVDSPLVSFTGDTKIEFLDGPDFIRDSKILILETTYLDQRKTVQQAREWGHTHLDELIPKLDDIRSEKIVLIHISSRYSLPEAQEIILKKIPPRHQDRIVIFPGR